MDGNHIKRLRNPRTVLDLGSGKGAWTVDMAQEFATADEVVGVDIESNAPLHYPPNCRFEVCQIRGSLMICRLQISKREFGIPKITFPLSIRDS